jgi:hypothetical protein
MKWLFLPALIVAAGLALCGVAYVILIYWVLPS